MPPADRSDPGTGCNPSRNGLTLVAGSWDPHRSGHRAPRLHRRRCGRWAHRILRVRDRDDPRPARQSNRRLDPDHPQTDAGHTIEPLVSVPNAAVTKLADTAWAEPELEPHGLRSSTYGFSPCRPTPLQPLDERVERKFAHSDILVLPRMIAPAARSLCHRRRILGWVRAQKRQGAAVVIMSTVSMLSLSRIGMPWSGPRGPCVRRSSSSASAIIRALALISRMERRLGPLRSSASIRSRYSWTS